MMNRRESLAALGALAAGAALPLRAAEIPAAADQSPLIYITPIRSDGRESRCQAEVWFVREGASLYVVTTTETWRARAVQAGLNTARIWVGDKGVWSRSRTYRQLPSVRATASLVTDRERHAELLKTFGAKYVSEWTKWGPRFADGLADGSRVMLRYQVG